MTRMGSVGLIPGGDALASTLAFANAALGFDPCDELASTAGPYAFGSTSGLSPTVSYHEYDVYEECSSPSVLLLDSGDGTTLALVLPSLDFGLGTTIIASL